jgi:hypothetical protein
MFVLGNPADLTGNHRFSPSIFCKAGGIKVKQKNDKDLKLDHFVSPSETIT